MKYEITFLASNDDGSPMFLADRCVLSAKDTKDAAVQYAALCISGPNPQMARDIQPVVVTRELVRKVLRDQCLTVTGTGQGDQVFDALLDEAGEYQGRRTVTAGGAPHVPACFCTHRRANHDLSGQGRCLNCPCTHYTPKG